MENSQIFSEKKYCIVKNAISKDVVDLATQYALIKEMFEHQSDSDVPNSHSVYGDTLMESFLVLLQPIIEKNTGLQLLPTYSYYRIYRDGDSLKAHVDREACEISVSVCLGYNYDDSQSQYPLWVNDTPIYQNTGDILIYRGIDLTHFRLKLQAPQGIFHAQLFLHYVDANGPHAGLIYDNRESIGIRRLNLFLQKS